MTVVTVVVGEPQFGVMDPQQEVDKNINDGSHIQEVHRLV